MQVVSTAQWVGNNDPSQPHQFANGYYNLEVKIPFADLPAAVGPTSTPPAGSASGNVVDPEHMGLNIIPYIERNQLHIDQSTREAWSAWNSVQSDPYHWGHAYLQGYTPPAGQSDTPTAPIIPASAAQGVDSPQTIYQSARNGVPIAGLAPAPASDQLSITSSSLSAVVPRPSPLTASRIRPGARLPVVRRPLLHPRSGPRAAPRSFEAGLHAVLVPPTAQAAPWGTDMGGHLIADQVVQVSAGSQTVSIPLDSSDAVQRAQGGRLGPGRRSRRRRTRCRRSPCR